jgi:hypothetical protein
LAVKLGEFKSGGRIDVTDHLAAGPFHKTIQDFDVSLRKLELPAAAPAELDFGFSTDAGESSPTRAAWASRPQGGGAARTQPASTCRPTSSTWPRDEGGRAAVRQGGWAARLRFAGRRRPAVKLKAERLALKDLGLRLKGEKTELVRVGLLELRDTAVDTAARKLAIGEVNGKATRVVLIRAADGLSTPSAWPARRGKPASKPAASRRQARPRPALAGGGEARGPRRLGPAGGRPHPAPAIVFNAEPLTLRVDGLSTAKGSKAKLDLQAGINKRGQFGVKGTLGLAPLAGNLDLDLKAVDITMLQPYVTEKVKIAITRGKLTSRGRLAFELPAGAGRRAASRAT